MKLKLIFSLQCNRPPRVVYRTFWGIFKTFIIPSPGRYLQTFALKELENKADALLVKVIKAAIEEHPRLVLLNRFPLRLTQMPVTTPTLVQKFENLLPEVKRVIERIMEAN